MSLLSIIAPAFPPSSRVTLFLPAICLSRHPTTALPVKVNILMRSSATIRSARFDAQGNTLNPPVGKPDSETTSPSNRAIKGVLDAGLMIIGFPDAIAGATLWTTRFNGKLKGEMPNIGPIGNLLLIAVLFFERPEMSNGMYSPNILLDSSAAIWNVPTALSTSARASVMGFPASSAIVRANSSLLLWIPSPILQRISALL